MIDVLTHATASIDHMLRMVISQMDSVLLLISIMVVAHVMNALLRGRLNILGIHPRKLIGLIGIAFSPFLHINGKHLFSNLIMLVCLSLFMLAQVQTHYFHVTAYIILLSGGLIWAFGRPGCHIGASALVMGYFGFILCHGFHSVSMVTALLALACLYYFSGLLRQLFPEQPGVSWEGHLLGFLSGIILALIV